MYDSPLNLVYEDLGMRMSQEIDGMVITALKKCSVDIDEKKLISALEQDKARYEEAYEKGFAAGKASMRIPYRGIWRLKHSWTKIF